MDPIDIRRQVAATPWYHTIELPGGIVTPGEYDHRRTLDHSLLPRSLRGMRCLDVGTHDGFWAFEMERRGASEIVAIDIDDPDQYDWPLPRTSLTVEMRNTLLDRWQAFDIAHAALGSKVQRRKLSVYELSSDSVGTFDIALIGTLLHHLRDPIGALMRLRRVVRSLLVVNGSISILRSLFMPRTPACVYFTTTAPFWELPNISGLRRQVTAAGFEVLSQSRPYLQRWGQGAIGRPAVCLRPRALVSLPRAVVNHVGTPHISLLARPTGE